MTDARFTPIATSDRITTLDVIRGVALFGILLMNVEFFNRPISELDIGLPPGVTGIDYWAGWFVHVFIRSKFWTMFSLLFGMGFAVMLGRAQAAGRPFLTPYVRRTLALALFGFLHCVFIWNGDILFDYAMAAAFLLIVFHAKPKVLLWIAVVALLVAAASGGALSPGYEQKIWIGGLMIGGPLLVLGILAWAIRKWPANGLRNAGLVLFLLPCIGLLIGGLATPQTTQAERDRAATRRCQDAEGTHRIEQGARRAHEDDQGTRRKGRRPNAASIRPARTRRTSRSAWPNGRRTRSATSRSR